MRQQVLVLKGKNPRPTLGRFDRLFWVGLRRCWSRWTEVLVVVRADIVVSWHRAGFRLHWRFISHRADRGRPKIIHQVRRLIQRMAAENPTWGAPRIHGELLKLGLEVSERTVSRYLAQVGRHADAGKRWRIFLRNHREAIAAMDFFTGISFIALRRLQVYIRLPQSSPPSTVFLPEGPTGSQPPFYESQKLIAWASRTSFFRYLSIPVGYRNHFLGCRRLGYPEGSDSPSIRPSMLANSRRLRWLSANNNQ